MCNEESFIVPATTPPVPSMWDKMVYLGRAYNSFISLPFLQNYSLNETAAIVHVDLGITRANNITKKLLALCDAKLQVPAERLQKLGRFSPFMVSRSYLHAKFPETTTTFNAVTSNTLIVALEALIAGIAASDNMEMLPEKLCTDFLDALENHIAMFGEFTPMSFDEANTRLLTSFEQCLAITYMQDRLDPMTYARAGEAIFALSTKMIQRGMTAEMQRVEVEVESRFRAAAAVP